MKRLPVDEGLRVFDIRWETDTAGPSPDNNKRVEVFLLGCNKAMKGNPCIGCFNSPTWDKNIAKFSQDPIELADYIANTTKSRYLTIGGGEPTDQIKHLIPFVKRLKEHGFHIMMYTWRKLLDVMDCNFQYIMPSYIDEAQYSYRLDLDIKDLLEYLDIVVDGEFEQNECLYQENLGDGMLSSIGSGNQIIWDIKAYNEQVDRPKRKGRYLSGKYMRDLVGLYIKPDTNDLVYITKE